MHFYDDKAMQASQRAASKTLGVLAELYLNAVQNSDNASAAAINKVMLATERAAMGIKALAERQAGTKEHLAIVAYGIVRRGNDDRQFVSEITPANAYSLDRRKHFWHTTNEIKNEQLLADMGWVISIITGEDF